MKKPAVIWRYRRFQYIREDSGGCSDRSSLGRIPDYFGHVELLGRMILRSLILAHSAVDAAPNGTCESTYFQMS